MSTSRPLAVTVRAALVRAGAGSRRVVAAALGEKKVTVNGAVAPVNALLQPGDKVAINDRSIAVHMSPEQQTHTTLLLHKPLGVVSTCHDPQVRISCCTFSSSPFRFKERPCRGPRLALLAPAHRA